ncbi:MAG: glycosyltransferase family 9 protein [Candidatus Omnitrophota bacterium]
MEKILFINPFGLGDVLFTTPLVRAVKNKYPDSFLGFICNQESACVLENNPFVDKVFFFTRGDFKKIKKKSFFKYLSNLLQAMLTIKKYRFDLCFDLSLVNQYNVVLWLLGVKQRWGINYKNRGFLLSSKINISGFKDKHVLIYYKELLQQQGVNNIEDKPEIFLTKKEKDKAQEFLKENNFVVNKAERIKQKLVGVVPFGGGSWGSDAKNKQWPIERFISVIKRINQDFNARIILFGSGLERQKAQELVTQAAEVKIINAVGKTSLRELFGLIECCDLVLANDSGPLHAATALGIKTVSIYGPVNEKVYGPLGEKENNIVLSKQLDCRPCYRNFTKTGCDIMQCLLSITEEEVLTSLERLIKG